MAVAGAVNFRLAERFCWRNLLSRGGEGDGDALRLALGEAGPGVGEGDGYGVGGRPGDGRQAAACDAGDELGFVEETVAGVLEVEGDLGRGFDDFDLA